jgi:hypothetical protein
LKLSPFVNVEVKMPKDILRALITHEFNCVGKQINSVTEESVKQFLRDRYSQSMADKFKPEYLLSIQET